MAVSDRARKFRPGTLWTPRPRPVFWQGTSGDEQSVSVTPFGRRPGRHPWNHNTISPLHGLLAGERPNTQYASKWVNGAMAPRRNQADVTDL